MLVKDYWVKVQLMGGMAEKETVPPPESLRADPTEGNREWMEKGAALNVFFREQNGRLPDTCHCTGDDCCTTEYGQKKTFRNVLHQRQQEHIDEERGASLFEAHWV